MDRGLERAFLEEVVVEAAEVEDPDRGVGSEGGSWGGWMMLGARSARVVSRVSCDEGTWMLGKGCA